MINRFFEALQTFDREVVRLQRRLYVLLALAVVLAAARLFMEWAA